MTTDPDPTLWVPVMDVIPCAFHKKHPGRSYAGCTCRAAYGMRPATDAEAAENRRRYVEQRRTELQAELESLGGR